MRLKPLLVKFIFGIALCLSLNLSVPSTQASASDNIFGYAWNPVIGWTKFNSCNYGAGCDTGAQYGVNLNTSDLSLSGYAWNSNVGWIQFDNSNTVGSSYPAGGYPQHGAQYDSASRTFSGWAKILALGDDGWIKLAKDSHDSGENYWTRLLDDGKLAGWAWNNKIGWLSFNSEDWATNTITYYVTGQTPLAPSNVTVVADSVDGCNTLLIDWGDNPYQVENYSVFRSTSASFTPATSNEVVPAVTVSSKKDNNNGSGLSLATDYYYHIGATNFFGTTYTSSSTHGRTNNICGIDTISGQGDCLNGDPSVIALNWQKPAVASSTAIDYFLIKRCLVSETDNCLQGSVNFAEVTSTSDCYRPHPGATSTPPSGVSTSTTTYCSGNSCHCWQTFAGDEVDEQYVYKIVAVDTIGQIGDDTDPAALIQIYPCAKQKSWHWEEQNPASTTVGN